jgi:hypothetical protein
MKKSLSDPGKYFEKVSDASLVNRVSKTNANAMFLDILSII